jgi:Xaa-Pro dipeptidase
MYLPVAIWSEIRDRLPEFTLTDGSGVVEGVRSVLSPAEVGFVRQAARLSDRGMQAGIEAVHDGVNEQAVVAAIYAAMIGAGSEQPGFVPLVRTRDVLLQEHIIWRDHVVQTGDALFLELSASVARYHAPLSRMVYLAEPPSGTGVAADIALAALEAVRATLRDGALAADAYAAWQQVVDDGLGHDRYRRHHCGYLTGIGFPPSWTGGGTPIGLRPGNDLVLRSGMVFHVLSWLIGQEPADFVVSDTVLVTETGGELLTTTDRGPLRA